MSNMNVDNHEISLLGDWSQDKAEEPSVTTEVLNAFKQGESVADIAKSKSVPMEIVEGVIRSNTLIIEQSVGHLVRMLSQLKKQLYDDGQGSRNHMPIMTDIGSAFCAGHCEGRYVGYMESTQKLADLFSILDLQRSQLEQLTRRKIGHDETK